MRVAEFCRSAWKPKLPWEYGHQIGGPAHDYSDSHLHLSARIYVSAHWHSGCNFQQAMKQYPLLTFLLALPFSTSCTTHEPTTEDNLQERCAQAAQALQSCVGAIPDGFVESCEVDSEGKTFELIDELVAAECVASDNAKADGLFEAAFASQCAPAVGAALIVTEARNGGYTRLNAEDRRTLRSFFGDLADDTKFYFNARIIDEWDLGFSSVQFAFDIAAQTFGNKVFVDDRYRPGDEDQLALLAHELQHVRQARRAGGFFPGFAYDYCKAFYASGFDYSSNKLEKEARNTARYFRNR